MNFSFIIPAHNEARSIASTIEAISGAARSCELTYEIICVDDSSTDETSIIAETSGAKVVHLNARQISVARNAGARIAQYEIFVFVDADTIIDQEVLRDVIASLENGAIGGGAKVRFDEPVPAWARLALPFFEWMLVKLGVIAGCFLWCRREAFVQIGGFDETVFAAEEVFFSRELRKIGRTVIVNSAVLTSGRKLRDYSVTEILARMFRVLIRGVGGVRSRENLDLWYERRDGSERKFD